MRLAQVRLINTVHFGELDALFFERSGRLLVLRSKRFAMPTPLGEVRFQRNEEGKKRYQGAKNSTRMSFSGVTRELKLEAVKSMTSEGPSASARVASKREEAEVRSVERRILGERDDDEWRRSPYYL
jgi:hypothetical protein